MQNKNTARREGEQFLATDMFAPLRNRSMRASD